MGLNQATKGKSKMGAAALQGATLQARRLPLTTVSGTSEISTGLTLPVGAIVEDVYLDIRAAAGDAIDVGLNGTGGDDDPDGFLDGISCATVGSAQGLAATGAVTVGALLRENISGATLAYGRKRHVVHSLSPITYTLTTAAVGLVGDIIVVYLET